MHCSNINLIKTGKYSRDQFALIRPLLIFALFVTVGCSIVRFLLMFKGIVVSDFIFVKFLFDGDPKHMLKSEMHILFY